MARYHVTMTRGGSIAYLSRWQDGANNDGIMGVHVAFTPSKANALVLDGAKAVVAVVGLRNNQSDSDIRYSTISAEETP